MKAGLIHVLCFGLICIPNKDSFTSAQTTQLLNHELLISLGCRNPCLLYTCFVHIVKVKFPVQIKLGKIGSVVLELRTSILIEDFFRPSNARKSRIAQMKVNQTCRGKCLSPDAKMIGMVQSSTEIVVVMVLILHLYFF